MLEAERASVSKRLETERNKGEPNDVSQLESRHTALGAQITELRSKTAGGITLPETPKRVKSIVDLTETPSRKLEFTTPTKRPQGTPPGSAQRLQRIISNMKQETQRRELVWGNKSDAKDKEIRGLQRQQQLTEQRFQALKGAADKAVDHERHKQQQIQAQVQRQQHILDRVSAQGQTAANEVIGLQQKVLQLHSAGQIDTQRYQEEISRLQQREARRKQEEADTMKAITSSQQAVRQMAIEHDKGMKALVGNIQQASQSHAMESMQLQLQTREMEQSSSIRERVDDLVGKVSQQYTPAMAGVQPSRKYLQQLEAIAKQHGDKRGIQIQYRKALDTFRQMQALASRAHAREPALAGKRDRGLSFVTPQQPPRSKARTSVPDEPAENIYTAEAKLMRGKVSDEGVQAGLKMSSVIAERQMSKLQNPLLVAEIIPKDWQSSIVQQYYSNPGLKFSSEHLKAGQQPAAEVIQSIQLGAREGSRDMQRKFATISQFRKGSQNQLLATWFKDLQAALYDSQKLANMVNSYEEQRKKLLAQRPDVSTGIEDDVLSLLKTLGYNQARFVESMKEIAKHHKGSLSWSITSEDRERIGMGRPRPFQEAMSKMNGLMSKYSANIVPLDAKHIVFERNMLLTLAHQQDSLSGRGATPTLKKMTTTAVDRAIQTAMEYVGTPWWKTMTGARKAVRRTGLGELLKGSAGPRLANLYTDREARASANRSFKLKKKLKKYDLTVHSPEQVDSVVKARTTKFDSLSVEELKKIQALYQAIANRQATSVERNTPEYAAASQYLFKLEQIIRERGSFEDTRSQTALLYGGRERPGRGRGQQHSKFGLGLPRKPRKKKANPKKTRVKTQKKTPQKEVTAPKEPKTALQKWQGQRKTFPKMQL